MTTRATSNRRRNRNQALHRLVSARSLLEAGPRPRKPAAGVWTQPNQNRGTLSSPTRKKDRDATCRASGSQSISIATRAREGIPTDYISLLLNHHRKRGYVGAELGCPWQRPKWNDSQSCIPPSQLFHCLERSGNYRSV